jgi:hypothetical protein
VKCVVFAKKIDNRRKYLEWKRPHKMILFYGELCRFSFKTVHYYNIIKYWVKVVHTEENKYMYVSLYIICSKMI